jgi:hypothetical protein
MSLAWFQYIVALAEPVVGNADNEPGKRVDR